MSLKPRLRKRSDIAKVLDCGVQEFHQKWSKFRWVLFFFQVCSGLFTVHPDHPGSMMIYMYLRSIGISAASSSTKVVHVFFPNKASSFCSLIPKVEIFLLTDHTDHKGSTRAKSNSSFIPWLVVKADRLLLVDEFWCLGIKQQKWIPAKNMTMRSQIATVILIPHPHCHLILIPNKNS